MRFDPHTHPLPAPAAWPWRLPIVRHLRAALARRNAERHYAAWPSFGALSAYRAYDDRIILAIWQGHL